MKCFLGSSTKSKGRVRGKTSKSKEKSIKGTRTPKSNNIEHQCEGHDDFSSLYPSGAKETKICLETELTEQD